MGLTEALPTGGGGLIPKRREIQKGQRGNHHLSLVLGGSQKKEKRDHLGGVAECVTSGRGNSKAHYLLGKEYGKRGEGNAAPLIILIAGEREERAEKGEGDPVSLGGEAPRSQSREKKKKAV